MHSFSWLPCIICAFDTSAKCICWGYFKTFKNIQAKKNYEIMELKLKNNDFGHS